MASLLVRRVGTIGAMATLGVAAMLAACSSSDHPGSSGGGSGGLPPTPPPGSDGGLDGSNDGSSSGGDAATDSGLPLGDLPTLDEPDSPCVQTKATSTTLFNGPDGPAPKNLQAFGSARFAWGPDTPAFITFDPSGTNPKSTPATVGALDSAFTAEGTTIGGYGIGNGNVDYQRYDSGGAASGAKVSIATGLSPSPTRLAVGGGGGASLVVYGSGSTLYGAGVTAGGASAGAPWTLETGATNPSFKVIYTGTNFAIAYGFDTAGGTSKARLAFATPAGLVGTPQDVYTSPVTVAVAGIAATSSGYLLLVDAGGDDHVYTVPLSSTGAVTGVARRLLGGDFPQAVSGNGGSVGLVTMSNDVAPPGASEGPRAPMFRALDTTGHPTGPWVCIGNQIDSKYVQTMGVLANGTGWDVVYKNVSDGTSLVRLSADGTNAQ
jgi:hypothetical protein